MYAQTGFYSQKAIRSEADFKGLQIRAMTGFDTKIYSALGGMPTVIPWAELYTALQRKVVTSMPNSLNAAADIKVWEVLSHFSMIGYVIGTGLLVVNKKSFDKLPADLQAVVTEAGKAYSLHQKEAITNIGNASLYQFLDHGMTLTKMPDPVVKKLRKAAQGVWSSWAKKVGPKGEEILKGAGLLK
jgi:TRAP-type C4-dicarboxylate transport system substrate-binding protein